MSMVIDHTCGNIVDKPKLLLSAGTMFSATTPLFYTLCYDNKYAQTGAVKEHNFLHKLYKKFDKTERYKDVGWRRKNTKIRPVNTNIPEGLCTGYSMIKGDTIDDYNNYYLKLWKQIKGKYKSVADFSNQNAILSKDFMEVIKPHILQHFNVKVVMVFRDPIRRAWSKCNDLCQMYQKNPFIEFVHNMYNRHADYGRIYQNYVDVWGRENVHALIMEEFWSGEKKTLCDFLDFDIKNIHENAYYPDKGSKAPQYNYLWDQWSSNTHDLDKITWDIACEKMQWIYDDFEKIFGYVPKEWKVWYQT